MRAFTAVAAVALAACASPLDQEVEATTSSHISGGNDIGSVKVTHYTLAREADFASESEFLCSGRGVAMQGTGIRNDGTYVKYVSGGGGWCGGGLCNCGSARFTTVGSVFGASGRSLIKNYSIAVDPNEIPLGSYVWLSAIGHWFRADDTGGGIIGKHIDVYTEESPTDLPASSPAFVTSEPHELSDPGPNGEGGSKQPPSSTTSERPSGGPFAALDIRYPIAAGGWVTQCAETERNQQKPNGERVWMTMSSGRTGSSRWAEAKYPQTPVGSCGAPVEGVYPIVFRSESGDNTTLGATWISQCAPDPGVARIFKVESSSLVDGHPIAPFHHNENDPSCSGVDSQ